MVATRHDGRIVHARFRDLPSFLSPGDLVVVNVSATLPAAVAALREDGTALDLHLSTPAPRLGGSYWVVELRRDGRPFTDARDDERLELPGGGRARLIAPYANGNRLWLARLDHPGSLESYLGRHGRAIRYALRPGDLAAARLPERLRARAGQRRDAERRTSVHRRADHEARRPRGPRRPADASHRRLLAGAARVARTPSATASRRRPPGSSTRFTAGTAA